MSTIEQTIGIDLGTTNSVVAHIEGEQAEIILNAEGQPRTPSVVAFLESGEVLTGEIARRQAATQPARTISSVKRLIGRLKEELEEGAELYPFEIGEDDQGRATVVVGGKHYLPEQVSALILDKLKAAAEEHFGQPVTKAILTVPAYFDDVQRHATLEAARIAGLEVLRLINEPTAAAMAFGLGKDCQETVAIYDFGGGTFDFSLLDIDGKTFEVLTSTGNSRLGGDDLDMALVDVVAEEFLEKHGIDLREDNLTLRRLKDELERVKCELSSSTTSALALPFIAYKGETPLHLERAFTRDGVERVFEPYVEETLRCCREALKSTSLRKGQIGKVILVGGSTRIPMVQEMVEDFFGVAPFRGVNPDEVVAIGAAMQGAVLAGQLEEVVLLDVTPHTLSIEIKGNRKSALIEKNSTIPVKVARSFTTTEDNQSFVHVHLMQGEAEKASDNRSLGKFTLSDIPEAPAGMPRIQVEVFVNADGVVEVSATESSTGQEKKLSTSFAYLNSDERRERQGLRRRRARRRTRGALQQKILESTPSSPKTLEGAAEPAPESTPPRPVAAEPAAPVQATSGSVEPAAAEAAPVAQLPTEGPTDTTIGIQDILTVGEAKPPAAPPPSEAAAAAEVVRSDEETIAQKPGKQAVKSPSDGESRRIDESLTQTQPADTPAAMLEHAATEPGRPTVSAAKTTPAESDPKLPTPDDLAPTIEMLNKGRADAEACAAYEAHRKSFLAFCRDHEDAEWLQSLKVRYFIYTKQPEEAREALVKLNVRWPRSEKEHYVLAGTLCHQYPNYIQARKDRAALAVERRDYKMAMLDLEFVAKREEGDTAVYDKLAGVYEKILEAGGDSAVQFKLVKMYLRRAEVDSAISLLQQLVQIPAYRERAEKVLGLCFWQKGLRYLAFQKFKTLAVDEEMKDTLYRLSVEMEENDELLHAKYALERIYENDISYRDVDEKLRKLTFRIDLMKDDRFGALDRKRVSVGGAPGKEALLGNRFEVIGEINRGSMGIVYKARDRILDDVVAIKILNDFLGADPDAVERFKQEARSARRLTHPNIVRIHDFFLLDEKKIISMEFIEGEDMKTILARNTTFSEDLVMHYLRQICDAMAYAHRFGVVHRDIKPANIMIDERNQVKVTDFGIAKVVDAAATNAGTMIMGTPLYMSPEQIQGGKIDRRVDVYALGIMLFELVTGTPPFYEGSIEYHHINSPLPDITAGISPILKKIITRCVKKKPEERYQSIEELIEDLPPNEAEQRVTAA